jgi:negative regulator of flagellin synthesis FlgM
MSRRGNTPPDCTSPDAPRHGICIKVSVTSAVIQANLFAHWSIIIVKFDPSVTRNSGLAARDGLRSPQADAGGASPLKQNTPLAPPNGYGAAQQYNAQQNNVSLSPLASQLRVLAAADDGDVDLRKVAEIKQAIADGRLTIDPHKVADGLLDDVRALLKKPSNGADPTQG